MTCSTPRSRGPLTLLTLFTLGIVGLPLGASPNAAAQPQQQNQSEQDNPARSTAEAVVRWLDKLEKRGQNIQSLQARIVYEKNNQLLGDRRIHTGDILYHDAARGPERQPRFHVAFEHLIVNNARRPHRVDYIFDGNWLVEKNHQRKLFLKRQVVPPGQQLDPLQIDGPFPVPIGQKRREVLQRFNVKQIDPPEETDTLPNADELDNPPLHLRLTPREDAPNVKGREQFKQIDMWFNRDTLLPLRVRTVNDSQVETTVRLYNVRVNEIDDEQLAERFDTTPPEQGWRVETTPWQNANKR